MSARSCTLSSTTTHTHRRNHVFGPGSSWLHKLRETYQRIECAIGNGCKAKRTVWRERKYTLEINSQQQQLKQSVLELPRFHVAVEQDAIRDSVRASIDITVTLVIDSPLLKKDGFWYLVIGDADDKIIYRERLKYVPRIEVEVEFIVLLR